MVYNFMHSLHTSLARAAHDASTAARWRSRSIEDNTRSRMSPGARKTVNCSTKGWKMTRYRFKKQLAQQHLSDLLRSLTCEQNRRRTARVVSTALRASSFHPIELSTCSAWGTWCACLYIVETGVWLKHLHIINDVLFCWESKNKSTGKNPRSS